MTRSVQREHLSRGQARRVALAAQGFGGTRTPGPVTMRQLQSVVNRLGQFQIDSVNVVARAHYLPLFSRLGPYAPGLLERAASTPPRRLFEYWGHEASLIDVSLEPALRWRMAAAAEQAWGRMREIQAEQPDLVDFVRSEIADHGPLTARQLAADEQRAERTHWGWNWSATKTCLEWLFWSGEVSAARRNTQFERVYDLTDRVLPASVRAQPTPTREEAALVLIRRAARALGVASDRCLADYFRMDLTRARTAVAALVEGGELCPVTVAGWNRPTYLWHEAALPRWVRARALLSPFDSLVFERSRVEAIFAFTYRLEIYVPEAKRVHGYYVYPFLLGDELVGRVDLKADRARGVLRVNAAWVEPGHEPGAVAAELSAELELMASWQSLSAVEVLPRGDLAAALDTALGCR